MAKRRGVSGSGEGPASFSIGSDSSSRESEGGISSSPSNASAHAQAAQRAPTLDALPTMCHMLANGSEADQLEATTQFRRLLSVEKSPPIDAVIRTGVVPAFVSLLQNASNPKLQFEAAWALTNIASGTTDHTHAVIDAGAIPLFIRLLDSASEDVREQAVWALGNIAGDGAKARDLVLAQGAMQPFLRHLVPEAKLSLIRNATWTLSNFCRGKPPPAFVVMREALPTLAALIHAQDSDVLADALWALSYLSDGDNSRLTAVLEAGIIPRVVELLHFPSQAVKSPALRIVGNIVTGDDIQTQAVITAGALPAIHKLLLHDKRIIKKEACWTVSNVMAGSIEQIQSVLEANLVSVLLQLLRSGEWEVRKEAVWALSNATSGGSAEQIDFLVKQGLMSPLSDILKVDDHKIVSVALEGVENVLKSGDYIATNQGGDNPHIDVCERAGVPEALLTLDHHSDKISRKAEELLEKYFGYGRDHEDDNIEQIDDEGGVLGGGGGGGGSFQFGGEGNMGGPAGFFQQQWGQPGGVAPGAIVPAAIPAGPMAAPFGVGMVGGMAGAGGGPSMNNFNAQQPFNFGGNFGVPPGAAGGMVPPPQVPGAPPQQQQPFNFGGGFHFS